MSARPASASALTGVLGLTALAAIAISALTGPVATPLGESLRALIGLSDDPLTTMIVTEIRLPRALAAFIAGAALGLSGAALQGLLRNPLAEPGVLGVSAMASLGAVTAIYFGLAAAAAWTTQAFAAGFALLSTVILYAIGANRVSATTLILVGVGLSSFAGALTALAMNLAPNPFSLSDLVNWLLGSVANRSFSDLAATAPLFLIGAILVFASGAGLRALTLGEEAALGVGLNLKRTRALVIIGASLLAGGAVALAGAIGFVGVVAAHVVRPFCGHDPQRILAPAAMLGGVMLAGADLAVRLAPFAQELKLGVAAALIGAPAFIFIAARVGSARS